MKTKRFNFDYLICLVVNALWKIGSILIFVYDSRILS